MQIEKNIAATLRHRMEAEKKSKLEFSKEPRHSALDISGLSERRKLPAVGFH
ncbi:MAG: hypothetical protein ACLUFI_10135 [Oscillospiraceae bacterium]